MTHDLWSSWACQCEVCSAAWDAHVARSEQAVDNAAVDYWEPKADLYREVPPACDDQCSEMSGHCGLAYCERGLPLSGYLL